MSEIQRLLQTKNNKNYSPGVAKKIRTWQDDNFSWAINYIYGIEKDYRLVKVGKVGCYLHGDGLANVIHSDGLARLGHSDYKGKLLIKDKDFQQDNRQFDILVSNPPYSISAFRNNASKFYGKEDFELYKNLTDNSSEIECLFVERTKQLLKDGGVAGVILPSSILSNEGIYTKAREIILQYFEIVAITELGSNTFMATGTNTVALFLKRRNNYDCINLKESIERFFENFQDVTLNGIEKPFSKYVAYVWENLSFDDYITLLKKKPNKAVTNHEIYKEYRKKIKTKTEKDFWNAVIETEKEKLLYFILAFPQKVVLVKTGEKDAEKRFLGYEFSNRRGSEGIHPMQRGKTIAECTKLFDDDEFENPEKASTYIYKAFSGDYDFPIHETLKENISRVRLVDMLTFDRESFAKNISTAVKKKVTIESKWEVVRIGQVAATQYGFTDKATDIGEIRYLRITDLNNDGTINLENEKKFISPNEETKQQYLLNDNDIVIARSGSVGKSAIFKSNKYNDMIFASYLIRLKVIENKVLPDYLFAFTKTQMYWNQVEINSIAVTQPNLNAEKIKEFKIPLPPLEIQQQIVSEIEVLEKKGAVAKEKIEKLKGNIKQNFIILDSKATKTLRLSDTDTFDISIGKRVLSDEVTSKGIPVFSANVFEPFGFIDKYLITDFSVPSVIWGIDGDWMVNYMSADKPFYPTDHCGILRVKNNKIVPKYLSWLLNEEGERTGFSRTLRASIDRIQGLSVKVPPLSEQQKIVSEIEKIEKQIVELEQQLAELPARKEQVLKKYLQ